MVLQTNNWVIFLSKHQIACNYYNFNYLDINLINQMNISYFMQLYEVVEERKRVPIFYYNYVIAEFGFLII